MLVHLIILVFAFFLFLMSGFGWGAVVLRAARQEYAAFPFYTAAVGLGAWAALGGLLNLLHLVYPTSLLGIVISGLLLFIWVLKNPPTSPLPKTTTLLVYGLLFGLSLALLAGVYPYYYSFNYADDFQQYMPRIARALALGGSGGDLFSGEGWDSLGVHAFLQSFVLIFGTYQHLVIFDFGFCFLISLGLLVELQISLKIKHYWLGIILFILINPQLVNTSAVYSASLFSLALLIALNRSLTDLKQHIPLKAHALIPVGLLLSAAVGLKLTQAFFILLFMAVYFLLLWFKFRVGIIWTFSKIIGWLGLFTLPWLLVYREKYLSLSATDSAASSLDFSTHFTLDYFLASLGNYPLLLNSKDELFYGGVPLSYSLCAVIILLSGVIIHSRRHTGRDNHLFIALAYSYALAYAVYPFMFPNMDNLRYLSSALLVALPVLLSVLIHELRLSGKLVLKDTLLVTGILLLSLLPLMDFLGLLVQRVNKLTRFKTYLAYEYATRPHHQRDLVNLLSSHEHIASLQRLTRPGDGILAWLDAPFHLDYARNPVHTINPVGFSAPWNDLPLGASPEEFSAYLRQRNIRYIIWAYTGDTVYSAQELREFMANPNVTTQRVGIYGLYLRDMLQKLTAQSTPILDDGKRVLLELEF